MNILSTQLKQFYNYIYNSKTFEYKCTNEGKFKEKFTIKKVDNDSEYDDILKTVKKNRILLKKYENIIYIYNFIKPHYIKNKFLLNKYEKEILIKHKKTNLPDVSILPSHNLHIQENLNYFKSKKQIKKILLLINIFADKKLCDLNQVRFDEFNAINYKFYNKGVNRFDINFIDIDDINLEQKNNNIKNELKSLYKTCNDKFKNIKNFNQYNIDYILIQNLKNLEIKEKKDFIYSCINVNLNYLNGIKKTYGNNYFDENANIIYSFVQILYTIKNQNIDGSSIILLKLMNKSVFEQLIFILDKFYKKLKVINNCLSSSTSNELFILCENFKGNDSKLNKILVDTYKKILNFDYSLGIKSSNYENLIIKLIEYEPLDRISKFTDNIYKIYKDKIKKSIKICNILEEYYTELENKNKIKLYEFIINHQYEYAIKKCNELGIPLNPVLIEYIKEKDETNSPRLFEIDLYNVKKVQKYKYPIKDDDTINSMIARRELDIEEGSLDEDQINFFQDIFNKNSWIKNIAEIGFNIGISADTFLSKVPFSNVTSFDILVHEYVYDAKEFIDKKYPNRHLLIGGNSQYTVPYFHRRFPNIKFDMIFIDGDHSFYGAKKDIINMKNLAHKKTIMIFDDILPHKGSGAGPTKAWNWCKNNKIIKNAKVVTFSKNKAVGIANYNL